MKKEIKKIEKDSDLHRGANDKENSVMSLKTLLNHNNRLKYSIIGSAPTYSYLSCGLLPIGSNAFLSWRGRELILYFYTQILH